MSSTLLRQVTIVHTAVTDGPHDVSIVDGIIREITPSIAAMGGRATERAAGDSVDVAEVVDVDVIDLAGHLLLPAAVEPHAHLDKAYLSERAVNETGDLTGAIDAMIRLGGTVGHDDIVERAERAARRMAANGYVAVRTHVDTTEYTGVTNVAALVEVRERLIDVIDIEIVALAGTPVVGASGERGRALLRECVEAGADLVGGCPHLEPDGLIDEATAIFLQIAADAGVGVDLHTDETLDPAVMGLEHLARQVVTGFPHPVTASHCVSLGQRSAAEQHRIAELVAAAGIGVVTLPHTNLWLGGRDQQPVPRGLTAVAALRAAGVAVAAGADNLQDPFNPLGRACPFETAGLMVLVAHDLPPVAWSAVSRDARRVLGRPGGTIEVGAPADLVAVPATSLRQAIAEGPSGRRVFRAGREVTSQESC
ncbi:MAG TPA: amidohydrolase family protein [Ilumatobacteraceae bacterium]|nr:amidohydrolase family protein [Ilumatobacteraceae bacterium]